MSDNENSLCSFKDSNGAKIIKISNLTYPFIRLWNVDYDLMSVKMLTEKLMHVKLCAIIHYAALAAMCVFSMTE